MHEPSEKDDAQPSSGPVEPSPAKADAKTEHGGPKGLEPTRYGDWERNGKCVDF